MLTGPLLKAARVLAGRSVQEVAQRSGLGEATIKRAEAAAAETRMTHANLAALKSAYATLGVEFLSRDDGAVGVVIRSSDQD